MSVRAEMLRLGTRCLLKGKPGPAASLAERRRRAAAADRWVRDPPPGIERVALDAGGVPADRVTRTGSRADRHILYLHGGAFCAGSPQLYRNLTWRLAGAAGATALVPDYRLAPEYPFPAALDDAMSAYDWLLADGADPRRIAVAGDSAGGGLVFSLLLGLRDSGRPLPAAAAALSPWTDLALTGASLKENAAKDPLLDARQLPRVTRWYLDGADPRQPAASPVYGDCRGLPPVLIQVGSDEILHDDAVRMAERMRAGGCRGNARNLAADAACLASLCRNIARSAPRDCPHRRVSAPPPMIAPPPGMRPRRVPDPPPDRADNAVQRRQQRPEAGDRAPARRQRPGKDQRAFDDRREVRAEQRVLQPHDKEIVHQIHAVGIGAEAVQHRRADCAQNAGPQQAQKSSSRKRPAHSWHSRRPAHPTDAAAPACSSNPVSASQRPKPASAAPSQAIQCPASGPFAASSRPSMPRAPAAIPAKK